MKASVTRSVPAVGGALGGPVQNARLLHHADESAHQHCILLIDDHLVVRAGLKAALTMLHCRVMDTGNATEALDLLQRGLRPCLIFLDPEMALAGAWLFRAFQLADQQLATIPVAILSARDLCMATADGLLVRHWLVKPPDIEEMVQLAATYCPADSRAASWHQEHEDRYLDVTRPAS